MGIGPKYHCIVIGAGNIGHAVSNYHAFVDMGFEVQALFDVRTEVLGGTRTGLPVFAMDTLDEYLKENKVDIGIIAVPENTAQPVCDALVKGGVGAIWNFAPVDLSVPDTVTLKSVHLADALLELSYYMANPVATIEP